MFAVVGLGVALVKVLAVQAILGQLVAVRAETPEGAGGVVTAEGALLPLRLQTLVDVLAHLDRARHEAVGTLALKPAHRVGAGAVAANVA